MLNLHIFHYGFYLAMPASLLLVVCLVGWLPRALGGAPGSGVTFRALAIGVLAAGVIFHLRWSNEFYRLKSFAVGGGADTILTYDPGVSDRGALTAEALRWIEERTQRGATMIGLPEGIMLNYLSRRATTTPCMNFMMTEMILFGEESLLEGFRSRPPDYVVLVHKDTSEFGVGPFGADPRYGRRIMEWVDRHYTTAALFGEEPFRGKRFGIEILKRVPRAER